MFDSEVSRYYSESDGRDGVRHGNRYRNLSDDRYLNSREDFGRGRSRDSRDVRDAVRYHFGYQDERSGEDRYSEVRRDLYDYEDSFGERYGNHHDDFFRDRSVNRQNARVLSEDYDNAYDSEAYRKYRSIVDRDGRQETSRYSDDVRSTERDHGRGFDYERDRSHSAGSSYGRASFPGDDYLRDSRRPQTMESDESGGQEAKWGERIDPPRQSEFYRDIDTDLQQGRSAVEETDQSEESFYAQLEEFQIKARQLQEIVNDKQGRIEQLEGIVAEKDSENQKLRDKLADDQRKTGDYAVDIEEQVNRLSVLLGDGMNGMDQKISGLSEKLEDLENRLPVEMQEVSLDDGILSGHFHEQTKRMEDIFGSISEKLTEIISRQEGPQEQPSFDEAFSDQKSFLSNSMLTQEKKLKESFDGMTRQIDGMSRRLDGVKDELSEKIHSEDVKVYRNLQDYIQEQDHSEDDEKLMAKRYKALRNREYFNMVLTVVDIIIGIVFLVIIM